MKWNTTKVSLSALKDFSKEDIYGLHQHTEVTFKGETVAVLLPYDDYLRIQKMLLDAEAKMDCMIEKLGFAYNEDEVVSKK